MLPVPEMIDWVTSRLDQLPDPAPDTALKISDTNRRSQKSDGFNKVEDFSLRKDPALKAETQRTMEKHGNLKRHSARCKQVS